MLTGDGPKVETNMAEYYHSHCSALYLSNSLSRYLHRLDVIRSPIDIVHLNLSGEMSTHGVKSITPEHALLTLFVGWTNAERQ